MPRRLLDKEERMLHDDKELEKLILNGTRILVTVLQGGVNTGM